MDNKNTALLVSKRIKEYHNDDISIVNYLEALFTFLNKTNIVPNESFIDNTSLQLLKDNNINVDLFIKRKLKLKNAQLIVDAHKDLKELHNVCNSIINVFHGDIAKHYRNDIVNLCTSIENKLQAAWEFNQNAAYHTHWNKLPGCSCPKINNKERIGINDKVIDSNCIWHGK